MRRIAKRLIGREIRVSDVVVTDLLGHRICVPSLSEPVAFDLWLTGVYEPGTWRVIEQHLNNARVFVDVGANVGLFSLLAANSLGHRGSVVAIEASNIVFPYLERNIQAADYANVRCVNAACLEKDSATVEFYNAPMSHFGMGSLAPQFDCARTAVPGRSLDSLMEELNWRRVDVVKVDVEGYEAAVFRGASKLLTSRRPTIVFEFLDWAEQRAGEKLGAAQEILLRMGYALYKIDERPRVNTRIEGTMTSGGAMILAVPRERTPGDSTF